MPADRTAPQVDIVATADAREQVAVVVALWIVALIGGIGAQYLPIPLAPAQARALLVSAMLLNIALTLLAVIRHRRLAREVRERALAEARVETLVAHDPLTGLSNRRALHERAAAALVAARRRGLTIAVLAIDIDHFRTVNEARGHAAGDAVLTGVATALSGAVPADAVLARLGGDEFACVLPHDPDRPATVDLVARAIATRVARPFAFGRDAIHLTASIGIGRAEPDDAAIDGALRRADIAVAAARRSGGARACWFDEGMGQELAVRHAVEAGLREALPAGRIVPYYEQQIDLATGRLEGFEVLARWDHPTRGLLLPDAFIGVAEEAGLIGDLSLAIMRQAFEHAAGWNPSLMLSVNISPAQLKDPWLAERILKLLIDTGFPAHRLEIEITETSLFDNMSLARSIVTSLKNQGVRLALDDFGTGYSSLSHLRALPFDRIKIDKSFVLTVATDPDSAAIVAAITQLGHSLSVPVTAEGVETAEIADRLRTIGCDKAQGWHYGQPLSVRETRRLLAERALLGTARAVA